MKLIELLEVCNEAMTVSVYTEHQYLGLYNGRDSIPPECNNCIVLNITATNDLELGVLVKNGYDKRFTACTVVPDEMTGGAEQYEKDFDNKEDAIHWAKLNDGVVFDNATDELVYTFIDIDEQEEAQK